MRFEFGNGVLKSYTKSPELERLLSFDEDIRKVGYVSLKDGEIDVNLGGALVDALRILPPSEEELPAFFNTSLYTLKCRLSGKIDVTATAQQGIVLDIMRESVFTE